jgi:putative hydrolase of the HAD superfamily
MSSLASSNIRGVVFDLDATLYVCDAFATLIQDSATDYIAGLKGISRQDADLLIGATRLRLTEESGTVQTLSAVCEELGGSVRELHRFFEETLRPEACLVRDERVILLLVHLAEKFQLYIYTNNNRALTTRIINYLGLEGLFRNIFTIDDTWVGKPDEEMLSRVLGEIGLSPAEALFVGDRYDVDLRLPEQRGCPVYLSQNLEQLLRLEELLNPPTRAGNAKSPAYPPAVRL